MQRLIAWIGDRAGWLLALVMIVQAVLLTWSAREHSPVVDEPSQLVAGLSHWRHGRMDLGGPTPPLTRVLAAAPVHFFQRPQLDWSRYSRNPAHRAEWLLGEDFMRANGAAAYEYFFTARLALVPFALLGTWLCFAMGRELLRSPVAGLAAGVFWAAAPESLGHGSLLTSHVPTAVLTLASVFAMWRFGRSPSWTGALVVGSLTGATMLASHVGLLMPLVQWVVLVAAWRTQTQAAASAFTSELSSAANVSTLPRLGMIVASLAVALSLVNGFYGFRGTLAPLGDLAFVSRLGTGEAWPETASPAMTTSRSRADCPDCDRQARVSLVSARQIPDAGGEQAMVLDAIPGNRLAGTALAKLPSPLPRRYLEGLDLACRDVEMGFVRPEAASFFNGQWRSGGSLFYFVVGLLLKTPLPLLLGTLLGLAMLMWSGAARETVRTESRSAWLGWLTLTLGIAVPLAIASFVGGAQRSLGLGLLALPLLAILAGGLALALGSAAQSTSAPNSNAVERTSGSSLAGAALGLCLAGHIAVTLTAGPHWLSYFNEFAGGSAQGQRWFADVNVDAGQDLPRVAQWIARHPEARDAVRIAYFGGYDPRALGVQASPPPPFLPEIAKRSEHDAQDMGPAPGWFIVSKNYLVGHPQPMPNGRGGWIAHTNRDPYAYFRAFEPVDRIGQSMFVYHLSAADVNRFRETAGLPRCSAALEHFVSRPHGTLTQPDCCPPTGVRTQVPNQQTPNLADRRVSTTAREP